MTKNKIFIVITIFLMLFTSMFLCACKNDDEITKTDSKKQDETINLTSEKVYAKSFTDVPKNGLLLLAKSPYWQDGMVGGNGKTGFVTSGSPYSDTIIYQNIDFLMPTARSRDDISDITFELETVRQAILNKTYYETSSAEWDYSYKYHPGHQLRLEHVKKEYTEYTRWTDYQTGEVGVNYTDEDGQWQRSTFTSRVDNVTITKITQSSSGSLINMNISIDDPSKMYGFAKYKVQNNEKDMLYKEMVADDASYIALVAHYPNYEVSPYKNGGYVGATYVLNVGGEKKKTIVNESMDKYNVAQNGQQISITNAQEVYLITALDRTTNMCEMEDFAEIEQYQILEDLVNKCANVSKKYKNNVGDFDYKKALTPSALMHAKYFNQVQVNFADESNKYLTNEDLLNIQKSSKRIKPEMLERVYKQGRYAMICNGGYTMSRLCGMWTGEWNSDWRAIYTMDANVNLQSSGINTANMQFFGDGYINFVYRQIEDWKLNAKKIYGIDNAVLCPVNTDGDRALCAEYYIGYPFQYWNAGAAWMIQPIYEYYQCFGDTKVLTDNGEKELLKDILLPLLELNANFWQGITTPKYYTDALGNACYDQNKTSLLEGERYLIIPSYSPENSTSGAYKSTLAVNAAMDISAAKYSLAMAIEIEQEVNGNKNIEKINKYRELLNNLPNYLYDQSGAVKEWCANGYNENNNHRHISHLYLAWPAFETQDDEQLKNAAVQAIKNRNVALSATQGTQAHGWLHKGLVAARLKDGTIVEDCLYDLLSKQLNYKSFMTDHNTDRKSKVFCTDPCYGLVGIINEMLLYSNSGEIEFLPALPPSLTHGEINGLRTRTRAVVNMRWDEENIVATVKSDIDQTIKICGESIQFKAGEMKTFTYTNN